jgi:uncharacterized protein YjiS (DUF1127 family)
MEPMIRPALSMSAVARAPHPQRAWWPRIAQTLARLGRALAVERRRRRGIRQLQNLDERALADIGVGRGEIKSAARVGRHGFVNKAVSQGTARASAALHAPPLMGAQSPSRS